REFVDKGLSGHNRRLVEPAHAAHAVWKKNAVPVNRGVLRQAVRNQEPHAVALDGFDGRARSLAVVAPALDAHSRCKLANHWLCDEVELLRPVLHRPGQHVAVWRDDWRVGKAGSGGFSAW